MQLPSLPHSSLHEDTLTAYEISVLDASKIRSRQELAYLSICQIYRVSKRLGLLVLRLNLHVLIP